MRVAVSGLLLRPGDSKETLAALAAKRLGVPPGRIRRWQLLKRSLDARGHREPRFLCTVGVDVAGEGPWTALPGVSAWSSGVWKLRRPSIVVPTRPLIVGSGPAGLFAALRLCEYGLKPVVLERGKPVDERVRDVARYWREGTLDFESNVLFGEGGAGTFSDGKLTYRGRDFRKEWVFEALVSAGAPEEILWEAKPHLGTDRLRSILRRLRRALEASGTEIRFGTRVEQLILDKGGVAGVQTADGPVAGSPVFLATGHSARDLYARLRSQGLQLEGKGFAVGVRIEVDQDSVDRCQYGRWAGEEGLPRAEFTLKARGATGRDAYSFCMCPGGVVIPAASEPETSAVNGMSASGRTGRWANAALVVPVSPSDWGGDVLEGIEFQRRIEKRAWSVGGLRRMPAQTVADFVKSSGSRRFPRSSCPWPLVGGSFDEILPPVVVETLRSALPLFARQMPALRHGVLIGVETRTSSPVRIPRDDSWESTTWGGLYPVGEGAGYAGGIVSAAVDGARAVDEFVSTIGGGVLELREEETEREALEED